MNGFLVSLHTSLKREASGLDPEAIHSRVKQGCDLTRPASLRNGMDGSLETDPHALFLIH